MHMQYVGKHLLSGSIIVSQDIHITKSHKVSKTVELLIKCATQTEQHYFKNTNI